MPLPLPNLDTRRWSDLVEEGRALIPRYAPEWTDHNVHDPGITILELLAWLIEQEIYRANRVPKRHLRKLLGLAGFPVEPPRPARVTLGFETSGNAPVALPPGLTLATIGASTDPAAATPKRFRLTTPLTVVPVTIRAVQSFDGRSYVDRTRQWLSAQSFPAWGNDPKAAAPLEPDSAPALYVGLDRRPPAGIDFRLWLSFAGGHSGTEERARMIAEALEQDELCRPRDFGGCDEGQDDEPSQSAPLPAHHSVTTVWECFDGTGWVDLQASDDTRSLTLDGAVAFAAPGNMQALALGPIADSLFYVRCRLVSGRPDSAPSVLSLVANGVEAEQSSDARTTFEILPGVTPAPGQAPLPWQRQPLKLAFDAFGRISALAAGVPGSWPEVLILDYQPATANSIGALTCVLVHAGRATGLPGDTKVLPGAPISHGECRLWVMGETAAEEWQRRPDLDAARPGDVSFALDPATGQISFGDGEHGDIPLAGSAIVAQHATTSAGSGNVAAGSRWQLLGADDVLNQALLGGALATIAAGLGRITNATAAKGGSLEEVSHAAVRAAEVLWSHERLVELAAGEASLDQLDREEVLARRPPPRATTLLDYERLSLAVPGTHVGRARAWAGVDPQYPCLRAPGTVTVAIVPTLPVGRPEPTAGLLDTVRRYLRRRRTIGTRLVVVGPEDVEVRVRASVRSRPRADAARTRADIVSALDAFLDPMTGGPEGRGWPFGRDVYRSEILQVIDNVQGVDHVLSLELFGGTEETACGNVCIGPTALTSPGPHEVEVI